MLDAFLKSEFAFPVIYGISAIALAWMWIQGFVERNVAERGALVHLTSQVGKGKIDGDNCIRGKSGVFAVPANFGKVSRGLRFALTMIYWNNTAAHVDIPGEVRAKFTRVFPLGLWTSLRFVCYTYVTPYREVQLKPPDVQQHVYKKCWLMLYGTDAAILAAMAYFLWERISLLVG